MTSRTSIALNNALRTGIILFVFALIGTAMLAATHDLTEPTIREGQLAQKRALLNQVLPAALYDNDLVADQKSVPPDDFLGTRQISSVWIGRRNGELGGVILEAVAPDGYSGDIGLLIGIDATGTVTGVRVTGHRETPGLGDYIDRAKSSWIDQFTGKSLTNPDAKHWKVAKDGGQFDARAGATITPRAVIKAVRNALTYFAQHRAAFAVPSKEKAK